MGVRLLALVALAAAVAVAGAALRDVAAGPVVAGGGSLAARPHDAGPVPTVHQAGFWDDWAFGDGPTPREHDGGALETVVRVVELAIVVAIVVAVWLHR